MYFLIVFTAFAQNVTVASQQPACPNQSLFYNCRVEFPSVVIAWVHNAFGRLAFIAGNEEEGRMMTSSDGRVVANLTMNEGMTLRMVASTLTIQPPLNDLNGTNLNGTTLTCEGVNDQAETIDDTATIMLAGKCMARSTVMLFIVTCVGGSKAPPIPIFIVRSVLYGQY